jgi:hypothetical protein
MHTRIHLQPMRGYTADDVSYVQASKERIFIRHHVQCSTDKVGFKAIMCSVALDPASLLERASVSPRVQ